MARILVTGGAGFIGSRLCRALAADGHDVTAFDVLLQKIHGVPAAHGPLVQATREVASLLVGDITDRAAVEAALTSQDIVIHLAAETGTGESMYEIERYCHTNVTGTALMLDILANDASRTVQKVVVASSRSIYGEGAYVAPGVGTVFPETREESDMLAGRFEPTWPGSTGPLTMIPTPENAILHPSSIYGITKLTQEHLVMTATQAMGIAGVALRYQNVYGPGQSLTNPYTGILSIFSTRIRQGMGINIFEDGLESRDFVFIDDVVRATQLVALDDRANHRIFNVGSGVATTVVDVVHGLLAAFDRDVPVDVTGDFRLGDIRHNVADISAIASTLDFAPRVSFAEGLSRFVGWVNGQPLEASSYEASLKELRDRNLLK